MTFDNDIDSYELDVQIPHLDNPDDIDRSTLDNAVAEYQEKIKNRTAFGWSMDHEHGRLTCVSHLVLSLAFVGDQLRARILPLEMARGVQLRQMIDLKIPFGLKVAGMYDPKTKSIKIEGINLRYIQK